MSEGDRPDPDGTEMIDLGDADVSAVDVPPSQPGVPAEPTHERSLPPPLPPEVRASAAPPAVHPSFAPPPPRSNRFYVLLLAAFLAVGIVAGIAIAVGTRGEKKAAAGGASSAPSAAAPAGSVMTLPTIDMTDETDGGN